MLVRHAGRRFAALTASARTAFGDLIREAPTTPEPIAEPADQARLEEPGRHEDARRYACLLVSEIKRYNEANPLAGLPDRSLPERLKGEIERCTNVYARRLATFNFFDEALCEILGAGDVDVLGQLDKTTGAPPNNAALDRPATAAQPLSLRT